MYQSLAVKQGRAFETKSVEALEIAGFKITDRGRQLKSIEIDIVALNQMGVLFYFSCKGSNRGYRPGLIRTDTLRKAIAEGYLLFRELSNINNGRELIPLTILTSHIPNKGRGLEMIKLLESHIIFDIVKIGDSQKLLELARIKNYVNL